MMWLLPVVMPDIPATASQTFGFYDLIAGTWYANQVLNEKPYQLKVVPPYSAATFTPDAMAGDSVR
jgi:hypothetical protein